MVTKPPITLASEVSVSQFSPFAEISGYKTELMLNLLKSSWEKIGHVILEDAAW